MSPYSDSGYDRTVAQATNGTACILTPCTLGYEPCCKYIDAQVMFVSYNGLRLVVYDTSFGFHMYAGHETNRSNPVIFALKVSGVSNIVTFDYLPNGTLLYPTVSFNNPAAAFMLDKRGQPIGTFGTSNSGQVLGLRVVADTYVQAISCNGTNFAVSIYDLLGNQLFYSPVPSAPACASNNIIDFATKPPYDPTSPFYDMYFLRAVTSATNASTTDVYMVGVSFLISIIFKLFICSIAFSI